MYVAELWRYPVKSCRGERLQEAQVHVDGIPGDRDLVVHDAAGRVVTGRTVPALLGLAPVIGPDGRVFVDGRPWDEEPVAEEVRAAAGEGAHLQVAHASERHDETALLLSTDGAVAALGVDVRRLRPNLVVGGVEGLAEREWAGRRLRAGEVEIVVGHLCERCVMTTIDPDTLEQDPGVLRDINERFDRRIALNCDVAVPGRVAVGDPVELLQR